MVSERQLAGERKNEQRTARQVRRTPWVVLAITILLTLGVGVTAVVDLRRLDTPAGAAQAWVQARLVGDCERYALLSVQAAADVERRSDDELCRALADTARAGIKEAIRTRVRVTAVEQAGNVARVQVELKAEEGPTRSARLLLSDRGRWQVVRDEAACGLLPCP